MVFGSARVGEGRTAPLPESQGVAVKDRLREGVSIAATAAMARGNELVEEWSWGRG